MKALLALFFIGCFQFSFAQNPELLANEWNLINIVVDGDALFPPDEPDINSDPFVTNFTVDAASSTGNTFSYSYCNNGANGDIQYTGTDTFTFPNGVNILAGGCDEAASQQFEFTFHDIYTDVATTYTYIIEDESDGDNKLTVIQANGDQAIYTSGEVLNAEDFKAFTFNLFPNPTTDILNISSALPIDSLIIYSIQGKVISALKNPASSINIQNLASGVYFVEVVSKGKAAVQQLVKK